MDIREIQNRAPLMAVFIRNGLEPPDPATCTSVSKSWALVEDEQIVGGVCVGVAGEHFILDYLAVDAPARGRGWGFRLLDTALRHARRENAHEIYTVTKVPAFFRKSGFRSIRRDDAPDFSQCFTCRQYQVDCFPDVMSLTFTSID